MEIIVFNQEELQNALESGYKSICLCDNKYELPAAADIVYTSVGQVTAAVCAGKSECENMGMRFLNFTPTHMNQANAFVPLRHNGLVNAKSGSLVTSAGSFSSSYRLSGSYQFTGSYQLASSYRFAGSYSYAASFTTSFASSFRTSFSLSGRSSAGSFTGLEDNNDGTIAVFGYGIDLI